VKRVKPSSLRRRVVLAVLTIMFFILTGTGSFAQIDVDKMNEKERKYLDGYCFYQKVLKKHWIAELEEKVSDGVLDAIREKAVKDKDYKASSLSPEALSSLHRRGRAIYKKKLAERYIKYVEPRLFGQTDYLPSEAYWTELPFKADCEKIYAEQAKQRAERAKQRQKEEREKAERQQREAQQRQAKVKKLLEQPTQAMVHVPGGSFTMGCALVERNCDRDRRPHHRVKVNDFEIGKYEVTQELWAAVMGTKVADCAQCPVEEVRWDAVQTFLKKLNELMGERYRLPTEAEWEYAARGGQQSKGYEYAGSNEPDSVAWYKENSGGHSNQVGHKQPNELGIYDMSGNVSEWVQDCWNANYVGAPSDGSAWQSGDCGQRVLRGGSWDNWPGDLRSAVRDWYSAGDRFDDLGFRLARTLP